MALAPPVGEAATIATGTPSSRAWSVAAIARASTSCRSAGSQRLAAIGDALQERHAASRRAAWNAGDQRLPLSLGELVTRVLSTPAGSSTSAMRRAASSSA